MDYDSNGNRISETEPQSLPERYVDPNQAIGERMDIADWLSKRQSQYDLAFGPEKDGPRYGEAAEEIRKLRERNLEHENRYDALDAYNDDLRKSVARLQAENERLRARVAELEGECAQLEWACNRG